MLRVLALVAFKESGKSTFFNAANALIPSQEIMLAGCLKKACSIAFCVAEDDFTDQLRKEQPAVFDSSLGNNASLVFDEDKLKIVLDVFGKLSDENVKKCLHTTGVTLETPRKMAQYIGTEVLRNCIDPDIHIKTAVSSMDPEKLNIVTDVRFPNEFDYFTRSHEMNTTTIHILRPDKVPEDLTNIHPSESHILSLGERCDHKLTNEDFEEYKKNAADLVSFLVRGG